MKRYDTDMLIPYLESLCALYFAEERLDAHRNSLYSDISRRVEGTSYSVPAQPSLESVGCASVALLGVGGFLTAVGIIDLFIEPTSLVMDLFLFVGVGSLLMFLGIQMIRAVRERNEERWLDYEAQMQIVSRIKKENDKAKEMVPSIYQELKVCERELSQIYALKDQLYDANIIPGSYRNKYTAVYLYDWFATGGSDDMDHALSMFVLEEMKSKLDCIIENQSELILNQYMIMSNQEKTLEQQDIHNRKMRAKLDSLVGVEQERLSYEKMNEGHLATLSFFAQSDYLRRL